MRKKLFQTTLILVVLSIIATLPCYATNVLLDWAYDGCVELYNYDLTQFSRNASIFR